MRGCWKPHVVDSSLMTPPIPVSSQAMVHAPRPNGPWTDAVPRWLRFAALALGGAVVASLVEGTFGSLPPHSDTPRTIWRDSVFVTLPTWLVAAAMLPLVLLVARRFPFVRGRMWRAIVVHLVAASAFVMLHLYATASMMRMAHPHARPAWFIVVDLLRLYSVAELLIYVSVVGLWHALFYQRAAIERERDAARLREDLTRARLESLRLQLNPHFLFNTLQAVAVMARTHETDALVGTVQGLANMLRAVLDDEFAHDVPLERELKLLRHYVGILEVRYRDRLTVHWDIDSACLGAMVPALILQPLVENAIVHGIDARPGPGVLSILARREGTELLLVVEDDGPGFSRPSEPRVRRVGLSNVRARLEHRWGGRARFEHGNPASRGARVALHIPFVEAPADGIALQTGHTASGARGEAGPEESIA